MKKHNSYRGNHTATLIAATSQAYWCVLWGIGNLKDNDEYFADKYG
jgi:hypothetical protein